jgi:hypothetical protein
MRTLVTAVSGLILALGVAASADAAERAGVLHCYGARKIGAIVGSFQEARCVFTSAYTGRRERYIAHIERAGLDIGITERSELVWTVFAPSSLGRRALAGEYVGALADATVGVGGGANVLVGGNNHTISLQPVSVKAETGLAIAAGAGRLQLR